MSLRNVWEDPQTWTGYCPGLRIEGNDLDASPPPVPACSTTQRLQLKMDGYTQFRLQAQDTLVHKLADGINALHNSRQHHVFIALYDEFWALKQSMSAIVSAVLDTPIQMLPDVWAWRVDASSAGWGPHRDKLISTIREDGTPNSLTAWVALSDATPENGCLYLLPAGEDLQYPTHPTARISDWQAVRALPASAGTCLIWNQNILHWGGKGRRWAEHPRISVAIEYQRADVPAYNEPLFDPYVIPNFTTRLAVVSKQILQYAHMYAVSDEVKSAAEYFVARGLSQPQKSCNNASYRTHTPRLTGALT